MIEVIFLKKYSRFLLLVLMFPIVLNAATKNSFAVSKNYLESYVNGLHDNNIYVEKGTTKFVYNSGVVSSNSNYKYAGLLNIDEFNLTKNEKGNTYLYDGREYWTMTESGNDAYVIDNSETHYSLLNKETGESGLR